MSPFFNWTLVKNVITNPSTVSLLDSSFTLIILLVAPTCLENSKFLYQTYKSMCLVPFTVVMNLYPFSYFFYHLHFMGKSLYIYPHSLHNLLMVYYYSDSLNAVLTTGESLSLSFFSCFKPVQNHHLLYKASPYISRQIPVLSYTLY